MGALSGDCQGCSSRAGTGCRAIAPLAMDVGTSTMVLQAKALEEVRAKATISKLQHPKRPTNPVALSSGRAALKVTDLR